MKKQNIILLVLGIIIVLLLGYLVYSETNKKGDKEKDPIQENKPADDLKNAYRQYDFSDNCKADEACDLKFDLNVNEKRVPVKYNKKSRNNSSDKTGLEENFVLSINNKFDIKGNSFQSINKIIAVGDVIALYRHKGSSVTGNSVEFYDLNGKLLKEVVNLTKEDATISIKVSFEKEAVKLDINKLNILLITGQNFGISGFTVKGSEYGEIKHCDDENLKKYNITENTVVAGTYTITYDKEKGLSDPELIKPVTLKDYRIKNSLCTD